MQPRIRKLALYSLMALVLMAFFVAMTGIVAREVSQREANKRDVAIEKAATKLIHDEALASRERLVTGCERSRADRASIARAFRAQSDYLNLVLQAKSVKEDVKRAARTNQRTQDESATDLESRTGVNLDCQRVFPKPAR